MHRLNFRLGRFSTFAAVVLGFFGCFTTETPKMDVAGTSISTGNPGSVKVGFKKGVLQYAFSGKIDLFAATQIPLPGFSPNPLASYSIDNQAEFIVSEGHASSIPDSLWPKSSNSGDSLFRFNLVFTQEKLGALVRGFVFDKKRKIVFLVDTASSKTAVEKAEVTASLLPLEPIRTNIPSSKLIHHRHNFLLVYGTGFYAESDSGRFLFPPMPKQEYEVVFMSVPGVQHAADPEETADTYTVTSTISAETNDTLLAVSIFESVPMPERYLH